MAYYRRLGISLAVCALLLMRGESTAWGGDEVRVNPGVWPLSNGLTFELGPQALLDRFGSPAIDETSDDAKLRQLMYRDFSAFFEADSGRMVRLELRGATALVSGIRIGTPWPIAISTLQISTEEDDRLELERAGYRLTLERLGAGVGAIRITRVEREASDSRPAKVAAISKIEPLSNGVDLSGSAEAVLARMGPPEQDDRRHPAVRLLLYKALELQFEAGGRRMNRANIVSNELSLACGISIGATKEMLKRTIPSIVEGIEGTPLRYVEPGWVVSFWLQDDRVARIELRRVTGG